MGERLPIPIKTLKIIETQAENARINVETVATIQPILEGCLTKVDELQKLFDKARKIFY